MKKRPEFKIERCVYPNGNPVYLYGLIDPYTAKMAEFMYNKLHLTANKTTILAFITGFAALAVMYYYQSFIGILIAAILITIRNFADTIDGKIARGTNTLSPLGGYSDIVSDWIFFHAAFFVVLGFMTNNVVLGFLCVTGYMSREFQRRMFEVKYGKKNAETADAKKISGIVSLVKKYDLAAWFLVLPIILLIEPVWVLYITFVIEYGLLFAELAFNYRILIRDNQRIWREIREDLDREAPAEHLIQSSTPIDDIREDGVEEAEENKINLYSMHP
jgi:phosphatidylglycerophosphate synthase